MMGIKKQRTFSVNNVESTEKRVTQTPIADEPYPESSNRASVTPSICVTNPTTRGNKRTTFMIHQGRSATPPPPERIVPRIAHPPVNAVLSPTYTAVTSVRTMSVAPSAVASSVASGEFPGQVNPIRVASRNDRRLTAQHLNQVDGISSGNSRRLTASFRKSQIPDRPPTLNVLPYRAPLASGPFERPANEYVSDHDRRNHQNRLASAFSIDTSITDVEQDTADARNAAAAALEGKDTSPPPPRKDSIPEYLDKVRDTTHTAPASSNPSQAPKGKHAAAPHVQQNLETARQASTPAFAAPALLVEPVSTHAHSSQRYTAYNPLDAPRVLTQQAPDAIKLPTRLPPADARHSRRHTRLYQRVEQANFDTQSQSSNGSLMESPYRLSARPDPLRSSAAPSNASTWATTNAGDQTSRASAASEASSQWETEGSSTPRMNQTFSFIHPRNPPPVPTRAPAPAPAFPPPHNLPTPPTPHPQSPKVTPESMTSPPTNAAQAGRVAMRRHSIDHAVAESQHHCAGCNCAGHQQQQQRRAPLMGFLTPERKRKIVAAITKEEYRRRPRNDEEKK
ncbi:uncharacterized protein MYCFIDRAFT_75608 [Pseudocercospora fijiensis CIRAD86]|uniref:Uncharacterized protein n=1 Tax=Pseudocercospora fijiensis (strain CIRAD86) TaxID=383855 RepID=N1QA45_PSEFD|nr:uncharacterized protein MYCFIDRAFT_75608 [Pseudocercospora fijiensis CIRAD86]EME87773.1 hypothetical protein MYCFIDRAFT_75608 [Pseudocercospora fijiensis CIRAD86]